MKRKLLSLISVLVISASLLTGCAPVAGAETEVEEIEYDRFVMVYKESRTRVYVDIETGVQYTLYDGAYGAAMEVLLDADGKPLLYEWED